MPPYVEAAEALVGSGAAVTVSQKKQLYRAGKDALIHTHTHTHLTPGMVHIYNPAHRRKGQKTCEFETNLHPLWGNYCLQD